MAKKKMSLTVIVLSIILLIAVVVGISYFGTAPGSIIGVSVEKSNVEVAETDNLVVDTSILESSKGASLSIVSPVCSDSDDGKDYYTKGVVGSPTGNIFTDTCIDSVTVKEYFCMDNKVYSVTAKQSFYKCENGRLLVDESLDPELPDCLDGAGPLLPGQSYCCMDSDDGKNYFVKGTTTAPSGTTYTDYCTSDVLVKEYYCKDGTTVMGVEASATGSGYVCKDGELVKEETPTYVGQLCMPGTNNHCGNAYVINNEYYCDIDDVTECTYGCENDKCLPPPSDGGTTPSTPSNVICDPYARDGCVDSNTYKECNADGTQWVEKDCVSPKECDNGVCTDKVNTCSDDVDCDDGNTCTTDTCISGVCSSEFIECKEGEYCNSQTGECETKVVPVVCKAYEVSENGECKFSINKLFTSSGLKEFWEDNTSTIVIASMFLVLAIVLLIIYLTKPKQSF